MIARQALVTKVAGAIGTAGRMWMRVMASARSPVWMLRDPIPIFALMDQGRTKIALNARNLNSTGRAHATWEIAVRSPRTNISRAGLKRLAMVYGMSPIAVSLRTRVIGRHPPLSKVSLFSMKSGAHRTVRAPSAAGSGSITATRTAQGNRRAMVIVRGAAATAAPAEVNLPTEN